MTILRDTSAEAVAKVCDSLNPGKAPSTVQVEVDKFADVPDEALTPQQRAIRDAFNKEAVDGKKWQGICGKKET